MIEAQVKMMGQAKAKAEAVRRYLLGEIRLWSMPPNERELSIAADLEGLPITMVRRPPRLQIECAGMMGKECHENSFTFCRLDPEKKSSVVTGWWVIGENYVLHSVVERDGTLSCVTPYALVEEQHEFEFVPDRKISWQEQPDGRIEATRDELPLPQIVRPDPEKTIKQCAVFEAELLKGVHPYKAWEAVLSL